MKNIDLCIEPIFPGINSVEKIKRVAAIGFSAIEFWFWDYEFDGTNLSPTPKNVDEIASITADLNIYINDIVVNSPDGLIGGSLTSKNDKDKYLDRLKETIEVSKKLRCGKMITCTGNILGEVSLELQRESIIETLTSAVEIAEKEEVTLLLEALNSTIDHPGYYLTSSKEGFEIVKEINSANLKLLYDVYHMQVMEGNLINTIKSNIGNIGHFHLANLPGRKEIYEGEINYKDILKTIDGTEYKGYVGLEYWPSHDFDESLNNTKMYLI